MSTASGKLEVLAEQCPTCIFRPGNPMKLRAGRVASMVRECYERQSFIPCHETMSHDEDDDNRADGPVCRGFFDAHGDASQLVRICERLGQIEFVEHRPTGLFAEPSE